MAKKIKTLPTEITVQGATLSRDDHEWAQISAVVDTAHNAVTITGVVGVAATPIRLVNASAVTLAKFLSDHFLK